MGDGAGDRSGSTRRGAGSARSLIPGERTALDFLQRMCGIATLTDRLRALDKYAVTVGGGRNHRPETIKERTVEQLGGTGSVLARQRRDHAEMNGLMDRHRALAGGEDREPSQEPGCS
ncbi:hypothetical protein [Streptomyces sp. NPDC088254]|uniref:hypothetical protein n=1 Tax=Streptomyces sp. NPDC088254 TaxID=3365847 RepID=UPI00382B2360